jgi:hypothetical protein
MRAEHCLLLARPLGGTQAGLWPLPGQAAGRPRVTAPQGLEPGAITGRGTRNGLVEAWDCSAFSMESLPAWVGHLSLQPPSCSSFLLSPFCFDAFLF